MGSCGNSRNPFWHSGPSVLPEVKLIPGIRAVVVALLKSASKMVKVAGLVLLFVLATALFLAEAIGNNERSRLGGPAGQFVIGAGRYLPAFPEGASNVRPLRGQVQRLGGAAAELRHDRALGARGRGGPAGHAPEGPQAGRKRAEWTTRRPETLRMDHSTRRKVQNALSTCRSETLRRDFCVPELLHPGQALTMVRVTTLDGWSDLAEPIYDVSASMALFMVPRGRATFGVALLADDALETS